ncbi:hypothetical protein HETIRDRAFT_481224 [Heterobasidion irregulare TC 32-1]|uniref:G-protein alpha subunit n=1 Tax=Heterobasidion irregulare (strain TC 32-1) TaxID=747525 RepID=W4JQE2_HETIT|nr:uncharacterized protein HETIRDRAFT_481224 [Heterobasidion irregulare TC 32-1]ETW75758.1 hypothetical protein HETIRDRAFT_481224 [Heterobasidion irregulare TC 32-1]
MHSRSTPDDDDPLAAALRPPPDESPDTRALRLAREEDARRVSRAIDDAIRAERQLNKKRRIVRVLLLGQSESGKSTTLRQFQRLYTPTAFREERVHWRAVVQLNLIRSVHTILAALAGGGGGGEEAGAGAGAADEPQSALWACRKDLMALWGSQRVREVLALKRVRLEDESGFFLNDLPRLTAHDYFPTDDDVLKARLKTIGVSEYKFELEAGPQSGTEWRIVDVGGSRFQVPTWVPFFDDVDAIIFLAPISAFDQVLAEDPKVNRLEDSVLLWKAVCSNRLLAHVDLVLFLNKCDLLARKLGAGTRLAKYVRSYGDRSNDVDTASKYFRSKFSAIQRAYSPAPRKFYGFCTSVTDTATTAGILVSVRDIVLRQHLRQSKLV